MGKEDSQAEQTVPSQETACFPTEEAVISVSRLINPWVSRYCTLPAIWPSQQNPAGHSSTQQVLPDTLKAVGCLPVERQILHFMVGLKPIDALLPWISRVYEVKGSLHPNYRTTNPWWCLASHADNSVIFARILMHLPLRPLQTPQCNEARCLWRSSN